MLAYKKWCHYKILATKESISTTLKVISATTRWAWPQKNNVVHWRTDQSNPVVAEIPFKVAVITFEIINNISGILNWVFQKWDYLTCNTILRIKWWNEVNIVNRFIKGCHDWKMYYTSNGLTFELYNSFRIYGKWLENSGDKISWKLLGNWQSNQRKANFHFRPSATVGQTII